MASVAEAKLAVHHGADAVGLVAAMPSGPGPIEDDLIAEIAKTVPPPVATFLLTSRLEADAIADHAEQVGTSAIQIVSHIAISEYPRLRRLARGRKLVQVIHVEGPEALDLARAYGEQADALLLDSGRPSAPVAELGGTGRTHDWSVSKSIVANVDRPVFLAGGITSANVAEAIRHVRPYGIDLCSGVRTNGLLDVVKLQALISAMQS